EAVRVKLPEETRHPPGGGGAEAQGAPLTRPCERVTGLVPPSPPRPPRGGGLGGRSSGDARPLPPDPPLRSGRSGEGGEEPGLASPRERPRVKGYSGGASDGPRGEEASWLGIPIRRISPSARANRTRRGPSCSAS